MHLNDLLLSPEESERRFQKIAKQNETCATAGHDYHTTGVANGTVYELCTRCCSTNARGRTLEEQQEWRKLSTTPFQFY